MQMYLLSLVVFCPARHPSHRESVPPYGGGFGEILPHGTFQGRNRGSPVVRYYLPDRQAVTAGDHKPKSDHLGKLDGLVCFHRTPGCSSSRVYIVKNRVSSHAPAEGPSRDQKP